VCVCVCVCVRASERKREKKRARVRNDPSRKKKKKKEYGKRIGYPLKKKGDSISLLSTARDVPRLLHGVRVELRSPGYRG